MSLLMMCWEVRPAPGAIPRAGCREEIYSIDRRGDNVCVKDIKEFQTLFISIRQHANRLVSMLAVEGTRMSRVGRLACLVGE